MSVRKFRNTPVIHEGVRFDSKGELARWQELKLLERAGQIRNLERQSKFSCVVNGVKVCNWIADFSYFEGERRIAEDFKSPATAKLPVFRLKTKLVQACHPGLTIQVVMR
jgi:hypothetical protein